MCSLHVYDMLFTYFTVQTWCYAIEQKTLLHGVLHDNKTALMAQLAPQPEVVLDFENQTLIELLSEDGLVIMAR